MRCRIFLWLGVLEACAGDPPAPSGSDVVDAATVDLADARSEPLEDADGAARDLPPPTDAQDAAPEATPDTATMDAAEPSVEAGSADALADASADLPAMDAPAAELPPALDAPSDRADARDSAAPDTARDVTPERGPDTSVTADAPEDTADPPGTWRSELFPADWRPLQEGGAPRPDGRFLHDFSYAGYRRGDAPPVGLGAVVRTVNLSDLGDASADATPAIQRALDEACAAGGGVVRLGSGTFRLRFPPTSVLSALRMSCSNLVLRGSGATGPSATQLLLDEPVARARALLLVRPLSYAVYTGSPSRPELALARDVLTPTRTLPLVAVTSLAPGDLVVLRTDLTSAFREAHGMDAAHTMDGDYWPAASTSGQLYLRRVVSVDPASTPPTVTLDAPTRYPLLRRDNARLFEPSGMLREVGIEDLAFGMIQHRTSAAGTLPGPLGDLADDAYDTEATAAYQVHASSGLRMDGVVDGWIVRVRTFSPPGNTSGAHVLSNALFLTDTTARVTVDQCAFGRPQYRGGGGNGYLFWVQGMDHLLRDGTARDGRHNLIVASLTASGDVFLRMSTQDPRYSDDTHRQLSHANLWDGTVLSRAWLQSVNRRSTSSGAGHTATQSVYWNTRAAVTHPSTVSASAGFPSGVLLESAQYGWGYAIGTRADPGASALVSTRSYTNVGWSRGDQGAPADHVEGVGRGATLFPASLYEAQRALRRARGER